MRNKRPFILGLIAFLAVCYLIANLTLKNLFSEERLRVMLIEPVQDQLGRQVEIGSVKVSLFSGIDLNGIVVREKNPAQDFVSIGTFRIKYELLPLLEKRLVIKEVLIDKPTVKIVKDAQGNFNFADISLKPKTIVKEVLPPDQQPAAPLPVTLIFDQIRINDLNLTFIDQTGKLPAIISTDGDLSFNVTLGKTLTEAKYRGTMELVVNGKYQSHRPVLLLKGDFDNQLINFIGELSAGLDKLAFDGKIVNLQTNPDLTLNLQGDKFNLDNLIAAKPGESKRVTKPAPPQVAPSNPNPTGPKLNAHGKITINELRHGKLTLQKLNLTYNFANSVFEVNDLTAGIFEGSISGKAGIDLSRPTPAFRGQLKADKLQMAAAMEALDKPKGYLAGELSADFSGRGTGTGWPEIRSNLDGQGKFLIVKGGLASSPISKALASLLGIAELDNLKFDKLSGTLKIAADQAALDSSLSSRALGIKAKGNVGLDGSLDLPLLLQLSPEYSQRLQERATFARYLADPSGRTTLTLKLKGTVDRPDLSLSSEGAVNQLKNALESRASEELNRALNKKLGGADKQNQAAAGELLNKLLGN